MTDRLEGECDTQTLGQTTHGRPNDESSAQGWKDSRPKRKMIARGYEAKGLEGMDSSGL